MGAELAVAGHHTVMRLTPGGARSAKAIIATGCHVVLAGVRRYDGRHGESTHLPGKLQPPRTPIYAGRLVKYRSWSRTASRSLNSTSLAWAMRSVTYWR